MITLKTVGQILSRFLSSFFFLGFVLASGGCVSIQPPEEEYVLATQALRSAEIVEAARHSPGLWYEAKKLYALGSQAFEDRRFDQARRAFVRSLELAEDAEERARVKIRLKGDFQ